MVKRPMDRSFPALSIRLCRSRFPSGIILLLPEEHPLIFLIVHYLLVIKSSASLETSLFLPIILFSVVPSLLLG